ncbi:unnamed protein product [Diamesa tonsa]
MIRKSCFSQAVRGISKIHKSQLLQNEDALEKSNYQKSKYDVKAYVWGLAETGALGTQKSLYKHKKINCRFVQHPTRLQFAENQKILNVACGYGFSVFVVNETNGISLFGTGINTDSQLGFHKHVGDKNKPIEILIYPAPIVLPKQCENDKLQAIVAAAGRAHTVVLMDNGTVFTLGNNSYGQCGRKVIEEEKYAGSSLIHKVDAEVLQNKKVVDVTCGQDHTMLITDCGTVFSCGWGADGQTGLNHYKNQDVLKCVEGEIKNEKIIKISCAADCVLALNKNGDVFGWGNSEYGQLSQEQQINVPLNLKFLKGLGKIVDVSSGGSFCAVLNENGDVFVWGFGLLGLGPQEGYSKEPKQIPPMLFGRNSFNEGNRVVSIKCGINHLGAINTDHDLFMWGRNKFGCLGLGHQKDQYFPYKSQVGAKVENFFCGVDHNIALCRPFI